MNKINYGVYISKEFNVCRVNISFAVFYMFDTIRLIAESWCYKEDTVSHLITLKKMYGKALCQLIKCLSFLPTSFSFKVLL